MKNFFFIVFILLSTFLTAQKKYDCIVITKYEGVSIDSFWAHKFVGYMYAITDSTIHLASKKIDTIFNWQDLQTVKFRKHNGFFRLVLPIDLFAAGAAAADAAISISNSQHGSCGCLEINQSYIPLFIFSATFVMALPVSAAVYFIVRNRNFSIKSYNNFLELKQKSAKYIFKSS